MKNEQQRIQKTENKRIEILFEQSIPTSYTSILGSILISLTLLWSTQNILYLFWSLGTVTFSVSRIILAKKFMLKSIKKKLYTKWLAYISINSFFTGTSWGLIAFIGFTNLSEFYRIFIISAVVFVSFGAISSYSYVVKSYYIYISSLIFTFVCGLALTQGMDYISLIILFILLHPALITTARQFNSNLVDSLTKQLEVERLLKQLESSHGQLEEKISERTADLVESKELAELANHAKSEFLANMTHELRTPLHAILSFSKLGIKKKDSISLDKIVGYCEKIHISGERLLELMDNLLELSKFDAGKVEFVIEKSPISEILENTLLDFEGLIQEKSIQLNLETPHQEKEVMLDQTRISQVIKNLLGNAIKFSPEHGTIKISIYQGDMVIGRRDTDEETQAAIHFTIRDEGVGIPESELSIIFDQFIQSSQTKTGAGGTGLGLAICREIIEAHSGKIWAENNPDKGASFHFVIPLPEEI